MSHPNLFEWRCRVYYEDTDAGGIVFYANYLKFFERARTEYFRKLGVQQEHIRQTQNQGFVVKTCSLDYHAAARLDDEIRLELELTQLGRASFELKQRAYRAETLCVAAEVKIAFVQLDQMKVIAIPTSLRKILQDEFALKNN